MERVTEAVCCEAIDYTKPLQYHYRPQRGWVNDPNGLVYFQGYYHVFYQHAPHYEVPWKEPMHWGHARTKDFLQWEELPPALYLDRDYDNNGCWSGSAIVKDDVLYLFYASVRGEEKVQTVSVARSVDGIHFEKYENNPIIACYPKEGGPDFRDPAVCCLDGHYYCVMATGNPQDRAARLLVYESNDLLAWEYCGVACEWEQKRYAECPSVLPYGKNMLLSASVKELDGSHYFSVMLGSFEQGKFRIEQSAEIDKGPDQYAGQIFSDPSGRAIMMSWTPGWRYAGYADRDIGCMSVAKEILRKDGTLLAWPVKELQHLLKDSDPCLTRTEDGFVVPRTGREPLVYRGEVKDLKILRDGYLAEIFVNGGREVYTVLL